MFLQVHHGQGQDGGCAKPIGLAEAFRILAVVLQGNTLAPYLYIIVIDYLMRQAFEGRDVGF